MIELTEGDKKFILMCKGHYQDIYPYTGNWVNTMKPLFKEVYGWSAKEHPRDYRYGLFQKLFDIYMLIRYDGSGSNQQLKGMFSAAFSRSIVRDQRQSIDRVINELCGLIQCNMVVEDGVKRYELK